MIHMQIEPPRAPYMRRFLRPRWSIKTRIQMIVKTVLTTPKIPVVRKEVLVPRMPMEANTVGLC